MADYSGDTSDEDVILPNSPLYQYLKEVQTENFENQTIHSKVDRKNYKPKLESNYLYFTDSIKSVFSALKHCVILFCDYIFPTASQFNENRLSKKVFQILTSKKLLIYEDKLFLESLELGNPKKHKNYSLMQFVKLPCLILSGISSIVCFNIYELESFDFLNDKLYWLLKAGKQTVFVLTSVFGAVFIYQISIFASQFFKCHYVVNEIYKISDCLSNISSLLKKSHKLLQESELIARGFTSAAVTSVAQRLELSYGLPLNSTKRQHPQFRKHIFLLVKEMFLLHRTSTSELIHKIPVKSEFSFSSQSIALLDLSEFGSFFSYDLSSDHELKKVLEVSDNFSITFLKMVYKLMELQISEFFKCLSLVSTISCNENHVSDISKVLNNLNSILKHISKEVYFSEQKLTYIYHYYRSLETACKDDTVASKELKTSVLEASVHNMSLRLKTALSRVLETEDYLNEHTPISKKNYTEKFLKHINELFLEIKYEMEACNECFEECNKELMPLESEGGNSHIGCVEINERNINDREFNGSMVKNTIECNAEPIIKDEVFEAFITQSMIESNKKETGFLEGNEKPNIDKKAASHLMRELKNILVVRADECRLREERALASKFQESKTESSLVSSDFTEDRHVTSESQVSNHLNLNAENPCNFSNDLVKEQVLKSHLEINDEAPKSGTFNSSKHSIFQNNLNENETVNLDDLKTLRDRRNYIHEAPLSMLVNNTEINDSNVVQKFPMKFILDNSNCSFPASIAALAAQRNQYLGHSSEECFEDGSGSECENDDKSEHDNNS